MIEGLEEYRAVKDELRLKSMLGPGVLGDIVNEPIRKKLKEVKQTSAIERKHDGDKDQDQS